MGPTVPGPTGVLRFRSPCWSPIRNQGTVWTGESSGGPGPPWPDGSAGDGMDLPVTPDHGLMFPSEAGDGKTIDHYMFRGESGSWAKSPSHGDSGRDEDVQAVDLPNRGGPETQPPWPASESLRHKASRRAGRGSWSPGLQGSRCPEEERPLRQPPVPPGAPAAPRPTPPPWKDHGSRTVPRNRGDSGAVLLRAITGSSAGKGLMWYRFSGIRAAFPRRPRR